MSAYRDKRSGRWRYKKRITLPDGRRGRIEGTPPINTKAAAEGAERKHIEGVLAIGDFKTRRYAAEQRNCKTKEVTYREFVPKFLEIAAMTNKPSEQATKESIARVHLIPEFGHLRLSEIDYAAIQDFAAKTLAKGRKPKSINNFLTVLRRSLDIAVKRKLLDKVPEFDWLKAPKPEFDFLSFEEADNVVKGADKEWRTMIVVAMRTGLRLGELLALRWTDVDLRAGKLVVRRSYSRGEFTTPKSNRSREVALSKEAVRELKQHRHLRGELVFCQEDGKPLRKSLCKHPLWRACKRAKLGREIGWHVLRHTFASHLVMRGAQLKAVQELLGHATIEMTMRYSHLSPDVTRNAVQLLDRGRQVVDDLANQG